MAHMSAMTHSGRKVPADTLAARVLLIRHEKGWSQREAAIACGVPFGTWQGIELGRGTRDLMKHIAAIAEGSGYDREWIAWGGPLEPPGGGGDGGVRREGIEPPTRWLSTSPGHTAYSKRLDSELIELPTAA